MKPGLRPEPFQGTLELFVPQTVDQGVDDWGEDSVNSRDELVGAPGINGLGPDVHEDHGRVEEGDHGEVRSAGGEGSPAARGRGDAQDSQGDVPVGQHSGHEWEHQDEEGQDEVNQPCGRVVRAGQFEDGGDVTEEVVQDVGTTERGAGDKVDLDHGDGEATHEGEGHQLDTQPRGHDGLVAQGVADGHVAVVGHGGQEHTLGAHQGAEEVELGHAAYEGDVPPLQEEAIQHLGDDVRLIPHLQERHGAQKVVHGPVEGGAAPDGEDDGQVLHQHEEVGEQEEEEEQVLQPGGRGEAHQDEGADLGHILAPHPLVRGTQGHKQPSGQMRAKDGWGKKAEVSLGVGFDPRRWCLVPQTAGEQ